MTTCSICGKPIIEQDYEDGNCTDTDTGEVHDACLIEWQDDEEYRRGDEEYDWTRGT